MMRISKICGRMLRQACPLGLLVLISACSSSRMTVDTAGPVSESGLIAADEIKGDPNVALEPAAPAINVVALRSLDTLLISAINRRAFPGAVIALGRDSLLVKMDGYGTFTYRSRRRMRPDSPFDLASLTKVVATTTAAMLLHEQGLLDIEAPVTKYLDGFGRADKRDITIRHLLTHSSGLPPFRTFYADSILTRQAVIDSIYAAPLDAAPGESYSYSDFGMIMMALVIEQITGEGFSDWCNENIFDPLGMTNTGFRQTGTTDPDVVPTELDDYFRHRLIQGEVHDENAWILGGVAGHAGLFSTARDLSRFATMMVRRGQYEGTQFLIPETIQLFTTVVDTSFSTRALGWDTRNPLPEPSSAGDYFGPRSYGHTGFTGTSMWIDPDAQLYVILLTNRVYPSRDSYAYLPVRRLIADITYEALVGLPAEHADEM